MKKLPRDQTVCRLKTQLLEVPFSLPANKKKEIINKFCKTLKKPPAREFDAYGAFKAPPWAKSIIVFQFSNNFIRILSKNLFILNVQFTINLIVRQNHFSFEYFSSNFQMLNGKTSIFDLRLKSKVIQLPSSKPRSSTRFLKKSSAKLHGNFFFGIPIFSRFSTHLHSSQPNHWNIRQKKPKPHPK